MMTRWCAAAALATLTLLPNAGAHADTHSNANCPPACITEYALPSIAGNQLGAGEPFGLSAGTNGQVWFSHGDTIDRITRGGEVKEFPITAQSSGTGWVALGPDRAIWFTERNTNAIGRITVGGRVTEYAIPGTSTSPTCPGGTSSVPQGIATGSDGALWFTEECGNRIGRITTAGQISEYPLPIADSHPLGIAAGPDGALWFTEKAAGQIGRITIVGQITEFPVSHGARLQRITAGPDGALWFTELGLNKVGRMTTAGSYSEYSAPGGPVGITVGPDSALWYVEFGGNKIARMDIAGQVTAEYAIPTAQSGALQLTVGPDAAIWFAESGVNQIGRLQIPGTNARGLISSSSGGVTGSFTVSFSSTASGRGEVYFGSGPGCTGLVEVATSDVSARSTQHTVVVTGNDMPGTVGDNGIVPGATYWYEAVTITATGSEIDNNIGECFRVTVPAE